VNVRSGLVSRVTQHAWLTEVIIFAGLDAPPGHPSTVYDLLANVTHESVAGTARDRAHTVWKVHLRAGSANPGASTDADASERWYQIQDLIVEETRKEMIFLGETVLQVCRFSVVWIPLQWLI
jgi:hypothetical protein